MEKSVKSAVAIASLVSADKSNKQFELEKNKAPNSAEPQSQRDVTRLAQAQESTTAETNADADEALLNLDWLFDINNTSLDVVDRYAATYKTMEEVLTGNPIKNLSNAVTTIYKSTAQAPRSNILLFDPAQAAALKKALVDAQRDFNRHAIRGPGEKGAKEAEIIKNKVVELALAAISEGADNNSTASKNDQRTNTPRFQDLYNALYGVKGAPDESSAPLFTMTFDLTKPSEARKQDRKDRTTADLDDPVKAKVANSSAFKTSSAVLTQVVKQRADNFSVFQEIDSQAKKTPGGVANRTESLLSAFENYYADCQYRSDAGEAVPTQVLSDLKKLIDKSWNPAMGGIGRFSTDEEALKGYRDNFFKHYQTGNDFAYNPTANSAFKESLDGYRRNLQAYGEEATNDATLADLRGGQRHALIGQMLNDILLKPEYASGPLAKELKILEGYLGEKKILALDAGEISAIQARVRSSPLLMELNMANATDAIAKEIVGCLDMDDRGKKASAAQVLSEALMRSDKTLLDPVAGFRGRFRGILSSEAYDISGRNSTNKHLLNLPDEALDVKALDIVSALIDPTKKGELDSLKAAASKNNGHYDAGFRPVTALRDQTLPDHIRSMVEEEGQAAGQKNAFGISAGQSKAFEITTRLGRQIGAYNQEVGIIFEERNRIAQEAEALLKNQGRVLKEGEIHGMLGVTSLKDDVSSYLTGKTFSDAAFIALQRKYQILVGQQDEIEGKQKLAEELQQKFLMAAADENSKKTIVAQTQVLLNDQDNKGLIKFELSHSDTGKNESLKQLQKDFDKSSELESKLDDLKLNEIKVSDLQGKQHTLGALVNQQSVSGLIHSANQRTLCGISGTTTDLMLALTAEYGKESVEGILTSLWDFSNPQDPGTANLSPRAKQLLASISIFMQRGNYHTPAEVAGGMLVAAGAILDKPEAKSATDMMERYQKLLKVMDEDPARLFIQEPDQQTLFRANLPNAIQSLLSETPPIEAAPPTPTTITNTVTAETSQPQPIADVAQLPTEISSSVNANPPLSAPGSGIASPDPVPTPVTSQPLSTESASSIPAGVNSASAQTVGTNIPPASNAQTPDLSAAVNTAASDEETIAEQSLSRFAEILKMPQALDFTDANRRAEEAQNVTGTIQVQSYEAFMTAVDSSKQVTDITNKFLSDLIFNTTSKALQLEGIEFEEKGVIKFPEIGIASEAINSLGAAFTIAGSGLTIAQNHAKNKVLLTQIAALKGKMAEIKPIFDSHSKLQAIFKERQAELEKLKKEGANDTNIIEQSNQKIVDLDAQITNFEQRIIGLNAESPEHIAQLTPDNLKKRQDDLTSFQSLLEKAQEDLLKTKNKLADASIRANTIKGLELQIAALNRTLPRLSEYVARNQAQFSLNLDKISSLEHRVRLTQTSSFLAGFSAVKGPLSVVKDALTFSGSAAGSTAGKAISVVFIPLSIAKTAFSGVKSAFDAHDAVKIDWKIDRLKNIQTALQKSSAATDTDQNTPNLDRKPVNAALDRLLGASIDSLKSEKNTKVFDATTNVVDGLAGVLGVASGALAIAGLAGVSSGVLAVPGAVITGVAALLGIAAAGMVIGSAALKRWRAKKQGDKLHDAQIGLGNLQSGMGMKEVAKKNPFVANLLKIESKRINREQATLTTPMTPREREFRIRQAVMERCAEYVETKHHNHNANLTCNALNDELKDMANVLKDAQRDFDVKPLTEANSKLEAGLTTQELDLLKRLVNDRPSGFTGAIPVPDSNNPNAQKEYFDLVQKVTRLREGSNATLDVKYPVTAAIASLTNKTAYFKEDQQYGSQGIASIYYAGSRKNAAETLLVMFGVAPIPVAEATADEYFKTQTGFATVGASNGLAANSQDSGAAAVLHVMRKHRKFGEKIMTSADQASGTSEGMAALSSLPGVGVATPRPTVKSALDRLNAFAAPATNQTGARSPSPAELMQKLSEKANQGNSYVQLSRKDAGSLENIRAYRNSGKLGTQFVKGLESKFKSYDDTKFTGPLFVGIQRKTDERDRHEFHMSVDPTASCRTQDGSVCKPDFLICNRSNIGSRADYVTYDRVEGQWYLSTSNQRVEVNLDPEVIRQKIAALTISLDEKMLYIQIQKDIADNCEIVGFEVTPTPVARTVVEGAPARPSMIPANAVMA